MKREELKALKVGMRIVQVSSEVAEWTQLGEVYEVVSIRTNRNGQVTELYLKSDFGSTFIAAFNAVRAYEVAV